MAEGRGDAVTRIVHIVPGVDDASNGMAVVAKLLAEEQGDAVVADLSRAARVSLAGGVEEVWVHGLWLPCIWLACLRILASGRRLVRMTHGSLGPIYLKKQSPALKRLVGPIERWLLRRSDRVVVTCEAEREWVRDYLGANRPRVEMTDLKRFFKLDCAACAMRGKTAPLHVMYLGRRHPQKGLEYLEEAADGMDGVELHEECGVSGGAKEIAWDWCDVLVLPTLSENFGLVVAEALARGKRAVTTDGAPAWEDDCDREVFNCGAGGGKILLGYDGRLAYLAGYRDGPRELRVELLRRAMELFL